MEKQLTERWMAYQRNGWVIRKEHMHGCRVTRVHMQGVLAVTANYC